MYIGHLGRVLSHCRLSMTVSIVLGFLPWGLSHTKFYFVHTAFYTLNTQTAAESGNLLEKQTLRPHPRATKSELTVQQIPW